ncbi:MAG: M23 family metallopeptidase [Bacteroidales bacterium]|nr:M23 family metallopeptidase [Bacteroidales bacterium]MBN2756551.1 M23 family metallopeptidase [Bacteroidales bacterium]
MKTLYLSIIISLTVNVTLQSQNLSAKLLRLKLFMLPETTFRFPCGDSIGHGYYVAQGFQNKWEHLGVDISGIGYCNSDLGDTIYAIANGIVANNWPTSYAAIYHKYEGRIIKSMYLHCDTILCSRGEFIKKGQAIATIGNIGTRCAHLHFEIAKDTSISMGGYGKPVGFYNPMLIIPHYKK